MNAPNEPRVVTIHRAQGAGGVAAAGARLAGPPLSWAPIVVGADRDGARRLGSPLADAPGAVFVPEGADAVETVDTVRAAIRDLGAMVVVGNDLPVAYAAAALEAHRGVRAAGWFHGDEDHYDDLLSRAGPLVSAWRAVSHPIAERCARAHDALGSPDHEPLPAPVDVAGVPAPMGRGPLRLLYLGRLEKRHKRVLDLAALLAALGERRLACLLTIAGDGPAREELREALGRAATPASAYEMLGAVPLRGVRGLIDAHHAVVLVSDSEGMPTSAMEAFAAGRPAFVTDGCGGAVRAIHLSGAGSVTPVGDASAMAEEIAGATREHMAAMGQRGFELARREFSLEALAPSFIALARQAHGAPSPVGRAGPTRAWDAVVATLDMVGPVDESSLSRLAREFASNQGVDHAALSIAPPSIPGREAKALARAMRALRAAGATRVGLYGGGRHTRALAPWLNEFPEVLAILDDRAGERGGPPDSIGGVRVVRPGEALSLALDAIVLSSDEHEREMLERARLVAPGLRIVALYARAA